MRYFLFPVLLLSLNACCWDVGKDKAFYTTQDIAVAITPTDSVIGINDTLSFIVKSSFLEQEFASASLEAFNIIVSTEWFNNLYNSSAENTISYFYISDNFIAKQTFERYFSVTDGFQDVEFKIVFNNPGYYFVSFDVIGSKSYKPKKHCKDMTYTEFSSKFVFNNGNYNQQYDSIYQITKENSESYYVSNQGYFIKVE